MASTGVPDHGGPVARSRGEGTAPAGSWRAIIRGERTKLGLTQADVAARAGLSLETVRKYERGTRLPPRESLDLILDALQVSVETRHLVLLDRGFHDPERFSPDRAPHYYFCPDEFPDFVEGVAWPMFTANELGEVAAANRAAQLLWDVDFAAEMARRKRATANLFVFMAERPFVERIANWDELLRHFVALYKAVPASQTMLEEPGALFTEVLAAFSASNPGGLGRLFQLWQSTPPRDPKVRWMYPVVWRESGFPDIRFHGIVNPASEPLGIGFNEWIPVDAASHATLEAVLAGRGEGPQARGRARSRR